MAALTMSGQMHADIPSMNSGNHGRNGERRISTVSESVHRQREQRRQNAGVVTYEKLARACCTCGVLGCAAGAGLVIMFLIGSYTNALGNITNLELISIPGFTLLVLGMIGAIAGIFFCWITPRITTSRPRCTRQDERSAGFGLDSDGGYYNHGMVLDAPPCYSDISRTASSRSWWTRELAESFRRTGTLRASQRPPTYLDATKQKTDPTEDDEPCPPSYEETVISSVA
uniref:Uncharacterized LOC100178244 n=1 Tax=Ciona intestinalis TaxID=7719 RepID=F7A2S8_CIOIN|nr:uncharacterized protein LOC100178244 [Ciona intestinalis]|eukprot:XP_002130598.1 uncharacterized protein LOC100178244 [Ciona intestinalis]